MKRCELCKLPARTYCESDQASLCWGCDAKVHGANFLVARHSRCLLCHTCHCLTPWNASGAKLGRTISVCIRCDGEGQDESHGGGGGGANEAVDGDNQVVPLSSATQLPLASPASSSSSSSSPPPPSSATSFSSDASGNGDGDAISRKRARDGSRTDVRHLVRGNNRRSFRRRRYAQAELTSRRVNGDGDGTGSIDSADERFHGSNDMDGTN